MTIPRAGAANARARGDFRRSNTLTETTTRDSAPDRETADDVQTRAKSGASVNVNMVMVPPTTKLKDGDMIFISDSQTTASRPEQ